MDDLFEDYESLPDEVQEFIQQWELDTNSDDGYTACAQLVSNLKTVGYTCDYGLDAVPFDLMKI